MLISVAGQKTEAGKRPLLEVWTHINTRPKVLLSMQAEEPESIAHVIFSIKRLKGSAGRRELELKVRGSK